ncbi:hypothetical protein OH76DRAFT_1095240 [Lentinus brumalis]|uniref:DNA replication regulator Sld3 C-terminal domain-containing protein n=1 Tax=Lentinus brumalis TaxID=2498619 RepID=A0A371CW38_9APHY|nr:hypothetical protein OH76DRAFT_1095240 [Polyporus brumalis]
MPLHFLIPALLRVSATAQLPSPRPAEASTSSPAAHPLHSLLKPILLTSRAASQKYHARIRRLLLEENEPADSEEEYLWYAYHKDKIGGEDEQDGGQNQATDKDAEYASHERLKNSWLEKFERREVQIQILLHLLLLSLPGERAAAPAPAEAESLPLPPSLSPKKPKKRKRKERERGRAEEPPPPPLEELLESYMDKMAMWQLMQSVDSSLDRGQARKSGKGKEKAQDDRDWMQAFCEDVVEPLFKEKLPELCALFRSKLFPDPDNSDMDSLLLSPQLSPKPTAKRLKSSSTATTGSSRSTSSATAAKGNGKEKGKDTDLQRSRSRSLSISLEQEKRERSRSLSVGPNGLRKRATMFEVTMTTKFSKARAAAKKAELERTASVPAPGPSLARTQSQREGGGDKTTKANTATKAASMGSVLVAATPVKPRRTLTQNMRTQSQSQARIPALFANAVAGASRPSGSRTQSQLQVASSSKLGRVDSLNIDTDDDDDDDMDQLATPTKARRQRTLSNVTEDGEGDEWKLRDSSPDRLTLGAAGSQEWFSSGDEGPPVSSSPADLGGFGGAHTTPVRAGSARGRILVSETPTKPR